MPYSANPTARLLNLKQQNLDFSSSYMSNQNILEMFSGLVLLLYRTSVPSLLNLGRIRKGPVIQKSTFVMSETSWSEMLGM